MNLSFRSRGSGNLACMLCAKRVTLPLFPSVRRYIYEFGRCYCRWAWYSGNTLDCGSNDPGSIPGAHIWTSSSVVERAAVNRKGVGSTPTLSANFLADPSKTDLFGPRDGDCVSHAINRTPNSLTRKQDVFVRQHSLRRLRCRFRIIRVHRSQRNSLPVVRSLLSRCPRRYERNCASLQCMCELPLGRRDPQISLR